MGSKPTQDLSDVAMEIKMASRQMEKEAKKAESAINSEKKKVAEALNKNQLEVAKIFAENAIRNKKNSIQLTRLAAKMSALGSKIEAADRTKNISSTMANCIPLIHNALVQMDKMGVSAKLDDFEKVFEDMDIKTEEINGAMDGMYTTSFDKKEVI